MVITFSLLAASRSTGQSSGSREDLENLQKCVNYLKQVENRLEFTSEYSCRFGWWIGRWYAAGKLLWDILYIPDFYSLTELSFVSDSLREAGDIPEHRPWFNGHIPSSDGSPMPQIETTAIAQDTAEMSNTIFNDMPASSNGPGPNFTLNNWDLQRLLLVEMGYLPNDSASITGNNMLPSVDSGNPHSLDPAGALHFNSETNTFLQTVNSAFAPLSDSTNFIK